MNKDGWLVVSEYESDDLASGSEDDKKLRKAKESASKAQMEDGTKIRRRNLLLIISFYVVSTSYLVIVLVV